MSALGQTAGAAGAIGLALAMVVPRASARVVGLLVAGAGWAILALELAPDGHGGLYAAVAGVGAAAAVALAALFVRVPWTLPLLTLACVPIGLDVEVGDTRGRLLVPLYAVVAAATLALVWRPRRTRDLGLVAWPLALLVALTGVSVLWSDDPRAGAVLLALYVLPLGLLALALARLTWRPGGSAVLALELVAIALGLAIAGGIEYVGREVSTAPGAAVVSDWYHPVGPVVDDPGAYGRFLVVAIVVSLAVAVRVRDPRASVPAALAAIVLGLGLVPSFSQPALVALAAALVVLLVAVWWERGLVPAALAVTVGAAIAGSFAVFRRDVLDVPGGGGPASVHDAIRTALDHPLAGVGAGAHSVPDAAVTVAAELGAGGLVLLAAVVVAALASLRRTRGAGGLALVAALVAIAVDSTFRGDLLRDPLFWGVLGLTAAAARRPVRPAAPREAPAGSAVESAAWLDTSPPRSYSSSSSRRARRSSIPSG
jgi:hypothetical protein